MITRPAIRLLREPLIALAAMGVLLLSACSWLSPSPELDAMARETYTQFRAGDVEAIRRNADIALIQDLTPEAMAQFRSQLPRADGATIRRIAYSQLSEAGGRSSQTLTYEYLWPEEAALVNVIFVQTARDAPTRLIGFTFKHASRADLKANDFTLSGKSPNHYLMLLGVIVSPVLMIIAVVMSILTPGLKRRWLWILGSLAAFGQFGINWTTGVVKFVLLHGALIGIALSKEDTLFVPWVIKFGPPLGAIIVISSLWRRRQTPPDKAAQDTPSP